MATSPLLGYPLPDAGATDQLPADLLTLVTAIEKHQVMSFASASDRDAKIPAANRVGGMVAWLASPGKFTYYDATLAAWADLFNPGVWASWTPTMQDVNGNPQNLGTGATQIGRYRQSGKGVQFQCTWNFGPIVSGNNGQVVFQLPPGLPGANVTGLQQTGACSLWVPNQSENYFGFWTIAAGGIVAQPHFPKDRVTSAMDFLKNPTTSAGTDGCPAITGTGYNYPLQPGGILTASGIYQIA